MALLEFEGFDLGHTVPGWVDGFDWATTMAGFTTAHTRTAGGRSAYVNDSNVGNRHPGRLFGSYHGSKSEFGCGVALKTALAHSTGMALFRIWEGATVHLSCTVDAAGALVLRRGDYTGTVLATSAFSGLSLNGAFQQVGVEVKIDDAAGYLKVYLNGDPTPVVQFTGDTRNGGAAGQADRISFCFQSGVSANGIYVDDWYLFDMVDGTATQGAPNDGYLGDLRVETERPNGNGAVNNFVGSDGNSVDNWQLVDDDSTTTDYVGSATSGDRDLYALTDLTAPTGTDVTEVVAVQLEALVAKSDAGAVPDLLGVVRASTGTVETFVLAAAAGISTAYTWFRGPILPQDPDNAAWTPTSVDAAQAGVEIGV